MASGRFIKNYSGIINKETTVSGSIGRSGTGTSDHNKLNNRDLADQHPIASITGLEDKLAEQNTKIQKQETKVGILIDKVSGIDTKLDSEITTRKEETGQLEKELAAEVTNRQTLAGHSLKITQNSDTVVEVDLVNADNKSISHQEIALNPGQHLEQVDLDYINKLLIFTFKDEQTLNCDISELIDDLNAQIEEESNRAQQIESQIQQDLDKNVKVAIETEIKNREEADAKNLQAAKDYTNLETTRAKAVEDELQNSIDTEIARATKAEADLQEEIDKKVGQLQIEDVSTVTSERQIESKTDLVTAYAFDPDESYYEFTYPVNKTDFYGSWIWKKFDPDMLLYNPKYRSTTHPYYFLSQNNYPRFMYGNNKKCSELVLYDLYSAGWQPFDNNVLGIFYGSRLPNLMTEGWKDTCWPFFSTNSTQPTGWVEDSDRNIVFYDHNGDSTDALPYLQQFATKISDDTLALPLSEDYIKAWTKVNITENEFLMSPSKYKRQLGNKNISFKKADTYKSDTEYYTKFTGVSDSTSLRGTWRIDSDPLDIDYDIKGWYFFVNTTDTIRKDTCPIFDGFILKKSGDNLVAQRYFDVKVEKIDNVNYYTDEALSTEYTIYNKDAGWLDENYKYISVARQYCWYDNSTDATAGENLHYDYSLLNFLTSHATKISDKLLGADYYTVEDFNNYLTENYTDNTCYKSVGTISEETFVQGTYFEKLIEDTEKQTYQDIVRFAIDTIPTKDTVIRSAIGKDVIKITDSNAIVNDYFTLAPETSKLNDSYAQIILENNAEISLTELTDYVVFTIPENVQHGYCSSVVLVIPETVTSLPYLIQNNSAFDLQMVQSGSIIDTLELSGNCQYNLLFMCNGVKLELYIQEISLE